MGIHGSIIIGWASFFLSSIFFSLSSFSHYFFHLIHFVTPWCNQNMAVWVVCTSESKSLLLHFHHHKFIHSKSWKQTNYCFVLQVSLVPNTKRQAQQPHKNTNYVFTIDTSEILHTNKRTSTDEPEAQEVGHMCKWAWTRADEPKTPWTGMNEGNTSVNEGWQANPYKHGQGWTRVEQPKTP